MRPDSSIAAERALGLVRVSAQDRLGRSRLHDHDAHAVRDHVVELACDPAPFERDRVARGQLALPVDAPAPVPHDPTDRERKTHREERGARHLDPVGVAVRPRDGGGHGERQDRERLAGGAFLVGGDRVGGHDEREERFRRRTLERGERDRRCPYHHRARHGPTPALVEREGRRDEEGGGEDVRLANTRPGIAREPQIELRVHQRRGREQPVPDPGVDPRQALPRRGFPFHRSTVSRCPGSRRHPAG